jgi:hypothetical protein
MKSSIVADTPKCPDCSGPMRLTRVLPTVLPKDCAPALYWEQHNATASVDFGWNPIESAPQPRPR